MYYRSLRERLLKEILYLLHYRILRIGSKNANILTLLACLMVKMSLLFLLITVFHIMCLWSEHHLKLQLENCLFLSLSGKSAWLDLSCHPGPNDIVLLPGQEVIVHCDVGNTEGGTNVTWWKNGQQLNPENLTVLPNGGLLLSQGEGSSVKGNYTCMYQNSFGAVKGRTGTIRLAGGFQNFYY